MTGAAKSLLPADFAPFPPGLVTANSLWELEAVNARAADDPPGRLTAAGLVIVPAAFDDGTGPGFREGDLPDLVPRFRALSGVTVRGCVVCPALTGADAKTVAAAFHGVYQTAKRLSALLPCAMPYVGFRGFLGPMAACLGADPGAAGILRTAAETVAMQDRTAFYAKLYID